MVVRKIKKFLFKDKYKIKIDKKYSKKIQKYIVNNMNDFVVMVIRSVSFLPKKEIIDMIKKDIYDNGPKMVEKFKYASPSENVVVESVKKGMAAADVLAKIYENIGLKNNDKVVGWTNPLLGISAEDQKYIDVIGDRDYVNNIISNIKVSVTNDGKATISEMEYEKLEDILVKGGIFDLSSFKRSYENNIRAAEDILKGLDSIRSDLDSVLDTRNNVGEIDENNQHMIKMYKYFLTVFSKLSDIVSKDIVSMNIGSSKLMKLADGIKKIVDVMRIDNSDARYYKSSDSDTNSEKKEND